MQIEDDDDDASRAAGAPCGLYADDPRYFLCAQTPAWQA